MQLTTELQNMWSKNGYSGQKKHVNPQLYLEILTLLSQQSIEVADMKPLGTELKDIIK